MTQIPSSLLDLITNAEDKKRYKEYFDSPAVTAFRKLLVQYLDKQINQSVEQSDRSSTFDKPAWSEFQAYKAGGRETARHLLKLLDR
jgi:hypothetical protein